MIILTTNIILYPVKNYDHHFNESILLGYTSWIIRTRGKNELIGYIGYKGISETKDKVEVNYEFLDKETFEFLAIEAIKKFIDHLFIIEKAHLKFIIFKSFKTDVKNHVLMKRLDAKKFYIDDKYIYWEIRNSSKIE